MKEENEHIISDREKRAWQAGKGRKPAHKRPELKAAQRIEFLELVAQMASQGTFERKLGLNAGDVAFYKKEFDIESQNEARRLARKLKKESGESREEQVLKEVAKARDAELVANNRLKELESRQKKEPKAKRSTNDVRQEDADRQRRFTAQQKVLQEPSVEWRLPIVPDEGSEAEQIARFRREITYRGFTFLRRKYTDVTLGQVKWEAARLGLDINWDLVKR